MNLPEERIKAIINSMAGAVVTAIRAGTPEDRERLMGTLQVMSDQIPNVSVDTADAKEFVFALISLLDGKPVGGETLNEVYSEIYAKIVERSFRTEKRADKPAREKQPGEPESDMREFLTQLAATVVLIMREGSTENKEEFVKKLDGIHDSLPIERRGDAGKFVLALSSILRGTPLSPVNLPTIYANVYNKILDTIKSSSH